MQKKREPAAPGKKRFSQQSQVKVNSTKFHRFVPKLGIDFPSSCAIF
jgi:hypothetical protein